MIRTLFNFESPLKSGDLNLLASLRGGVGVVNGFSNGLIEGDKLIISSTDSYDNNLYQPSWDVSEDPVNLIKHSCIARDGSFYINSDSRITVEPILGSKNKFTEVLLFAVHQSVNDPVVNPVTLVAYWNPTTISLSDIYKQYSNPSTIEDIYNKLSLSSFDTLLNSLSFYKKETMVLIGVYGKTLNTNTMVYEDFSLPISDTFPSVVPKNDPINNLLKTLIIHKAEYEKSVGELYDKLTTLSLDFENVNRRLDEITRRVGLIESKVSELFTK